jgi:hypothetical protein
MVAEVRTHIHNTTHSTGRMVLAELDLEVFFTLISNQKNITTPDLEVVQLFRSVGLTLAHSVQRNIEAVYAVLIILSS